jgi:hypothetical protein
MALTEPSMSPSRLNGSPRAHAASKGQDTMTKAKGPPNGFRNNQGIMLETSNHRKSSTPMMPAFMVSAPGKVIVFGEHAVVHGKVMIRFDVRHSNLYRRPLLLQYRCALIF